MQRNRLALAAIHATIHAATLAVMAVAAPARAGDFTPIETEAAFRDHVVDRTLSWPGGSAVIRGDGSTAGRMDKVGEYQGQWRWQDGFYCRSLVVNGTATEEKCLKVDLSGQTVRMTYDRGEGRSLDMNLD